MSERGRVRESEREGEKGQAREQEKRERNGKLQRQGIFCDLQPGNGDTDGDTEGEGGEEGWKEAREGGGLISNGMLRLLIDEDMNNLR